jgi:hypothetical protein
LLLRTRSVDCHHMSLDSSVGRASDCNRSTRKSSGGPQFDPGSGDAFCPRPQRSAWRWRHAQSHARGYPRPSASIHTHPHPSTPAWRWGPLSPTPRACLPHGACLPKVLASLMGMGLGFLGWSEGARPSPRPHGSTPVHTRPHPPAGARLPHGHGGASGRARARARHSRHRVSGGGA